MSTATMTSGWPLQIPTTAVEAGASQVQVTVNGLGERAGNADISQTVMILESIYGIQDRD